MSWFHEAGPQTTTMGETDMPLFKQVMPPLRRGVLTAAVQATRWSLGI